jgi:ribonuclease J
MIRILPLGGAGGVTKNMYVYEYVRSGKVLDRLIVDCGIGFPDEEMLGVDLLIPDASYLYGKEDSIRGIFLTHGHDDHIAGLPYIIPYFQKDIPIFASKLTAGFAENTLKDFGIDKKINIVNDNQVTRLGNFDIETISVTHSVPDSKHLAITTPEGIIYHGADFKFDWTPVDGKKPDLQKMAAVGKKGILCLLTDCLRVEKEGYSLSESSLRDNLAREIRGVKGKVIVTTMSSSIHRIQQVVNVAAEFGKKTAFIGRSMEENVKVAERLGFLRLPQNMIISKRQVKKFPPHKLCLVVAGSQGQMNSSLSRASRAEHQLFRVKPGDKVIFSADPIPGNEKAVYRVIDNFIKLGTSVSYKEITDDLHVSGHASAGELSLFLTLLSPQFIMPIGATFRQMSHFKELTKSLGFAERNFFLLDEGNTLEITQGQARRGTNLKLKTIIVDGLGIGDVGKLVLQDRRKMAENGMATVVIPVSQKDGRVIGQPEIITRGFVFVRDAKELLEDGKRLVSTIVPQGSKVTNWQAVKEKIVSQLTQFFFDETQRDPLILAMMVRAGS